MKKKSKIMAFLEKANEKGIISFRALEERELFEKMLLENEKKFQEAGIDSNALFNSFEKVLELYQEDFFRLGFLYSKVKD
ncbi:MULTISPECIES: hypothetical protein [Fusobacterium]|uniref:Uncharacterized protein n=1 Tax=Fusobacterium hominis TaxID=2764326 RepID=A0A7G9GXG3_9FUSO|nr:MULTISPECIES: hypothetical protein [Fusobacterium]MBR8702079.1 hypothetical protein [Fusobacterium sp. DD45]MBR8711881.1 hypothetical protein [Fusobacterium sp. DD28]MBR8752466.1 hypothetical protein [Fusobacterium sp. DD26]QNM15495.1 hypothetical protein H9Q81_01250 [Fusobacterium hominis]